MVVAVAEDVQAACSFNFTIFGSIDSCLVDSSLLPSQSLASMAIQNFQFVCFAYFRRCHLPASASRLAGEYTCFSLPAAKDSSEH